LASLERVAATLDVRVELAGRWHGGDGDRLLNWRHSQLAESVSAAIVGHAGWVVEPEVSFSIFGERGIIDLFCWHEASSHLLVIELKTEFVDVNELLGTLDRKVRLAPRVAAEKGRRPRIVSAWVIVTDSHTNRRHAASHSSLLKGRLPRDGRSLASFLDRPTVATVGLAFWPGVPAGNVARVGARISPSAAVRTTASEDDPASSAPSRVRKARSGPGFASAAGSHLDGTRGNVLRRNEWQDSRR
jgi:hypothetical protein